MGQKVREVMTPNPITLSATSSLMEAATVMRDQGIGTVLVEQKDGTLCGVATDRDIVIRGIAEGADPATTVLDRVCSHHLATLSPDDEVENAIDLMRKKAIRRIPVVEGGKAVGVLAIGDLAVERDPDSALGNISAAPPNQ